jgi:hypothetical protein
MDAGNAARMSDPRLNPNFCRRWRELAGRRPETRPEVQASQPPTEPHAERLARLAALLLAEHRRRRDCGEGGGL